MVILYPEIIKNVNKVNMPTGVYKDIESAVEILTKVAGPRLLAEKVKEFLDDLFKQGNIEIDENTLPLNDSEKLKEILAKWALLTVLGSLEKEKNVTVKYRNNRLENADEIMKKLDKKFKRYKSTLPDDLNKGKIGEVTKLSELLNKVPELEDKKGIASAVQEVTKAVKDAKEIVNIGDNKIGSVLKKLKKIKIFTTETPENLKDIKKYLYTSRKYLENVENKLEQNNLYTEKYKKGIKTNREKASKLIEQINEQLKVLTSVSEYVILKFNKTEDLDKTYKSGIKAIEDTIIQIIIKNYELPKKDGRNPIKNIIRSIIKGKGINIDSLSNQDTKNKIEDIINKYKENKFKKPLKNMINLLKKALDIEKEKYKEEITFNEGSNLDELIKKIRKTGDDKLMKAIETYKKIIQVKKYLDNDEQDKALHTVPKELLKKAEDIWRNEVYRNLGGKIQALAYSIEKLINYSQSVLEKEIERYNNEAKKHNERIRKQKDEIIKKILSIKENIEKTYNKEMRNIQDKISELNKYLSKLNEEIEKQNSIRERLQKGIEKYNNNIETFKEHACRLAYKLSIYQFTQ